MDIPMINATVKTIKAKIAKMGKFRAKPLGSSKLSLSQRLALPAGGWDETTPLCRNPLQATQTARKRADSHQSGARCVSLLLS